MSKKSDRPEKPTKDDIELLRELEHSMARAGLRQAAFFFKRAADAAERELIDQA